MGLSEKLKEAVTVGIIVGVVAAKLAVPIGGLQKEREKVILELNRVTPGIRNYIDSFMDIQGELGERGATYYLIQMDANNRVYQRSGNRFSLTDMGFSRSVNGFIIYDNRGNILQEIEYPPYGIIHW
ncbi:MAG: hypothetical protein ABIG95_05935 [Candidatus Woesearchaeota archaeon]